MSSIVLRGATEGMLDDVERAVDDGVNAFKVSQHRRSAGDRPFLRTAAASFTQWPG